MRLKIVNGGRGRGIRLDFADNCRSWELGFLSFSPLWRMLGKFCDKKLTNNKLHSNVLSKE